MVRPEALNGCLSVEIIPLSEIRRVNPLTTAKLTRSHFIEYLFGYPEECVLCLDGFILIQNEFGEAVFFGIANTHDIAPLQDFKLTRYFDIP